MSWKSLAVALAAASAVISAAAAQAPGAPEPPATPQAWRAAAESDLEALRLYLREDTPVAIDAENPRMQRWFEQGYREARARVRRVNDQASYLYALSAYTNGFGDPHLNLHATSPLAIARWPGFVAAASGGTATVHFRDESDPAAPVVGARIVSCDGQSIARLRERIVFPFTLNPQIARDRRASYPRLFLDRGNAFAPPPRRCVFEEQGRRRSRALMWRDIPEGDVYWTQYNLASNGPPAQFGVATPAEGVTWIGVPTFNNNAGERLRALVNEVAAQGDAIRSGRAVVIDLRGNGGGNSEWGAELARAVWGADIVSAVPEDSPGGATDWRVSQRNLDYINSFAPTLIEQFGAESDMAGWIRNVQNGFETALQSGQPIWRQRDPAETGPVPQGGGYTQRRPQGSSPIPARVYLLSNGTCGSACLNFADIALQIPGTLLIGEDTAGDGLLMEVRQQRLPSGLATVVLPMKVYRGRSRGALEAYRADVLYPGIWSDEAVRAWAMELIAQQ